MIGRSSHLRVTLTGFFSRRFVVADSNSRFTFGEATSVSVADAVAAFSSLRSVMKGVDLPRCSPEQLSELTAGVREGQQAFDLLLIQIGVLAERHAENSRGRGAHATMLGDGSRVRGQTALREAARSQTAAKMSKVGSAVDDGRIGVAQVDAITNAARGLNPDDQQRLNTDEVIDAAESLPADVFARKMHQEAERIKGDYGLADTKARQARSSWRHWIDQKTGMGKVFGEFDPERYEAIVGSVEARLGRLANEGGNSKTANLAAEAAYGLLTGKSGRSGGLPHINVVVDYQTLVGGTHEGSVRETAAGHLLPPDSVARLACDAVLRKVALNKQGVPIDVGRKHRTATDAQWQALRTLYRSCVWYGCDRPLGWCQVHHIHEWEHGGATDLCNLIPLCNQHHHAVHEGGWSVKLRDGRQLDIFQPEDVLWATTRPDRISPAQPAGP